MALSPKSFGLMIVHMSRRANSEAEVGPAAFAIAIIIGLLYLYLGGALLSGHGPTTPTVTQPELLGQKD
jgi:hypothetical protein